MGFQSTANTTNLIAKLTPSGRRKLITNTNTLITKFALGDSDANYNATPKLSSGKVPSPSGDLSSNGTSTSTFDGVNINSFINVDTALNIYKKVEDASSTISESRTLLGPTTLTGGTMTHLLVDRSDSTDGNVNLFYSFNLPLDSSDDTTFTSTTFANGGFSDTALSGLAQSNVLIIEIPNANYGELIDGKSIKLYLETISGSSAYTIYSTFENTTTTNKVMDGKYRETSPNSSTFGTNYALLFSDGIKRPNGDTGNTWSTGYGTPKPFSTYNKPRFNLQTDVNTSEEADLAVGIAYLDKGFIVITHPDIVDNFDVSGGTSTSATSLTFDSVVTEVSQQITCIAGRNEFVTSKNTTYGEGDIIRISEIGLYDDTNDLIAYAKPDRHILKKPTQFFSLGVKITV